tara:strand:+ start:473 stop:589 length:117 start_codon:yes stop_codon:yes gene_type:complete
MSSWGGFWVVVFSEKKFFLFVLVLLDSGACGFGFGWGG